jgi:hypothetical protein
MAQRSSIGVSFHGALDALTRVVAALAVAMMAIGLLTTGEASSMLPSLSTVVESTWLHGAGAVVSPRALDRDRAQRTNDDAYLEGLTKALDQN